MRRAQSRADLSVVARAARRSLHDARIGRLAWGFAILLAAASASAGTSPETALADAQRALGEVKQGVSTVEQAIRNGHPDQRGPEARIADGELLLRSKDYPRAASTFNQVIEKYPNHPTAYPDALFLLGETYFEDRQLLSARRVYRQIVDRGGAGAFATYFPRALARLVDVSLRVQDTATLDFVFEKISAMPGQAVGGELQYARGKGLLAKKDYAGARAALGAVPSASPHYPQARYLLGVVAMKESGVGSRLPGDGSETKSTIGAARARYAPAVEAFRQVTLLPADTAEHKHVVDLAWLAIGRLFYETDQYGRAAEAYGHVDRSSSEFSTMLYELSWDYVRLGDTERALRSLELLAVSDPNSPYLADGTLLRADLLLRTGQFEKSLSLYQSARGQYEPMRGKVDAFLSSSSDPAVYYDKLAKDKVEGIDPAADALPQLAVDWAREGEDGPAAFAVIDDAKQCRELLHQATAYADRMSSILTAPNRVRAFPELKAGEERALALLNASTRARMRLADGIDSLEDGQVAGEANQVREQRRSLRARIELLPVTPVDFAGREEQAQRQWNSVSQKLQQLTLQVDQLQALVNGLKRTLSEGLTRGVVRDPATVRQLEAELGQNEQDLAVYRSEMGSVRRQIDVARVQVGFGDQRFIEDAQVRAAFRKVFATETALAQGGSYGSGVTAYAARIAPVLAEADGVESRLEAVYADIEGRVGQRTEELRATLQRERQQIAEFMARLAALDSESRLIVGEVAMRNFANVRNRLKDIVVRADVGVTEEAWEVREEELTRVRNLQLERARSEQQLSSELREVLDDSGEGASATPSGASK